MSHILADTVENTRRIVTESTMETARSQFWSSFPLVVDAGLLDCSDVTLCHKISHLYHTYITKHHTDLTKYDIRCDMV